MRRSFEVDGSALMRRRYIMGGAHWSRWGRGRVGVVVTLEQLYRVVNSDRLERRLLAQTHVEF